MMLFNTSKRVWQCISQIIYASLIKFFYAIFKLKLLNRYQKI